MWSEIVERIKEKVQEGRELEYSEGAVGITSLLYCPLKWELRQKYPDIKPDAVEIDDGYLWERQVKEVLAEMFGKSFEEEKTLELVIEGVKIEGHLDTFVEQKDKVVGIELKAPKWIPLLAVPSIEGNLLLDEERKYTKVNELYITQAKVQRFLLERLYPEKKVEQYIFLKGMAECGRWRKKLYIVYPVSESITEEELREMVRRFKEDKSPRFPTECESYCEFYRQGICEGKEFAYEDGVWEEQKEEIKALIKEYRNLQGQLKNLEAQLKKKIKGSITVGSRKIGWVEKETVEIDIEKLLRKISLPEAQEFLQVKWQKKKEIEERFGNEVVKEKRTERTWRL